MIGRCGAWGKLVVALALMAGLARGGEEGPSEEAIRGAIEGGLEIVQKAARNYPDHRDCFSCHHQTLPAMAMAAAGRAGFEVDGALLEEVVAFSADAFEAQVENLRRGSGIGGSSMTVGYGLWTFLEGERDPDALSDAMAGFLLKNQQESGRWQSSTGRPPLEGSHLMCTTLAAYGLQEFAPLSYRKLAKEAVAKAEAWLVDTEPEDQEDRAAKLWGLWLLDADSGAIEAARARVLDAQREDGGWAQLDAMGSDAYATGQALTILARTGFGTDEPAYRRGLAFLIATQCEDGSWMVETRANGFQTPFDNGDPHGASSFISIAATSWAVSALAEAEARATDEAGTAPDAVEVGR